MPTTTNFRWFPAHLRATPGYSRTGLVVSNRMDVRKLRRLYRSLRRAGVSSFVARDGIIATLSIGQREAKYVPATAADVARWDALDEQRAAA